MTAPDIAVVPQFNGDEKMDKSTELDVEDSYYLLHALESEAFSCVVTAMRAQGMLTEYKQILLEHLKAALFVSDATYKAEMRRAANDEVLCKIAETLNPSYDPFVQWGMAANDVIPPAFNQIPLYADQDIEGLDVAGQLLRLANSHNSAVDNYNDALHELIMLPKAPFVPEKLRVLLRETESDSTERVNLNFGEMPSSSENRDGKALNSNEKSARKARTIQRSIKQEKSEGGRSLSNNVKPECLTDSYSNSSSSKIKMGFETVGGKPYLINDDCSEKKQVMEDSGIVNKVCESHSLVGNSVNVILPSTESSNISQSTLPEKTSEKSELIKGPLQQSNNWFAGFYEARRVEEKEHYKPAEEAKFKRKKPKQKENVKDSCARVRPFLFDFGSPGQAKPPRGNPDKRAAKRISPIFSCPTSTNGVSSGACLSSQSYATSASSRGSVSSSFLSSISRFTSPQGGHHASGVIIKRMRTSSSGEPNSSHNGYYGRIADGTISVKASQLSERPYSRVLVPPSQSSAAWSNPTRPYYGNPSAAAMGVTVRSSPVSSCTSGICNPSAGTSVEKILQPTQSIGNMNDPQSLTSRHFPSSSVFVTVGHQQNKISARRSSYSSKPSSVANPVVVHTCPVTNGSTQANASFKNPSSPGGRQAVIDRDASSVDVITKDDTSNSMNSDDCASAHEMRLECDEVMAPEHRCVVSPRSSGAISPLPVQIKRVLHTSDVPPRVSQQLSMLLSYEDGESSEVHLNRVVQPQFINGLLHQDDQEIVNLITSEQCMR
ncbi:unnamed protein product [Enterobius vermicularis]|uniref:ENT domain-containing protein n=1 Tax=Enterobius vermicularis TaxID=51028 RepID=A0A0N4UZD2_ENTVE|nr:unnamed protein product [Enterobius vermicularis]